MLGTLDAFRDGGRRCAQDSRNGGGEGGLDLHRDCLALAVTEGADECRLEFRMYLRVQ